MNPKIVEIVARAIYGELQKMAPTHLVAGIAWEDQREGLREYGRDQARAALTALSQAGYVVVPRKATPEMVEAAWAAALAENAGEVWDDMMDECLKENTDGTP